MIFCCHLGLCSLHLRLMQSDVLQASGNERQMSLLKCLIHSMYDEIRFLHDYPDHELDRTARLLGAVIRNG